MGITFVVHLLEFVGGSMEEMVRAYYGFVEDCERWHGAARDACGDRGSSQHRDEFPLPAGR